MKTRLSLIASLLITLLSACQPAAPDFTGRWAGNIAIVTLQQVGDRVTGSMEGYGDSWNFPVSGTVSGTILTFDGETPLGPLAIVLSEDGGTFHSADPKVAFCGSLAGALPPGCGYSGTWKLKADFLPEGTIARLTQTSGIVAGAAYGPDGAMVASLYSNVEWGKGWRALGVNEWGDFTLAMAADEKSFLISAPSVVFQPRDPTKKGVEWYGLREGLTTAYTGIYDCVIP